MIYNRANIIKKIINTRKISQVITVFIFEQVKTWFQNRRAKWRRLKQDGNANSQSDKRSDDGGNTNHGTDEDSADDLSSSEQQQQNSKEASTENSTARSVKKELDSESSPHHVPENTTSANSKPAPVPFPVAYEPCLQLSSEQSVSHAESTIPLLRHHHHNPYNSDYPPSAIQTSTSSSAYPLTHPQQNASMPQFHHLQTPHASYYHQSPAAVSMESYTQNNHEFSNHSLNNHMNQYAPQPTLNQSATHLQSLMPSYADQNNNISQ